MGVDAEYRQLVSNWPDRRFLELVEVKHPIIQAPMANAGGVELAIAAIDGGALGSLACGTLSPGQVREQTDEIRKRAKGPVNLNFLCHAMPEKADDSEWRALLKPYYDQFGIKPSAAGPLRLPFDDSACSVVEMLKPEVVSFHYGLPAMPLLDRVRATGAVILSSATTVAEALWLAERGVDAVIAQGFEAGGHSARFLGSSSTEAIGLASLLPQISDAISLPVIAAGGISDSRGIAAAFALGASAVQIGTAYLLTPESLVAPQFKDLIPDRPTMMTNLYSGGLARAPRGRLIEELGPVRAEAPPFPLASDAVMPLWVEAQRRGEWDFLLPLAGQSAALAERLPAAQLTHKLAADTLEIMANRTDA